MYIYIYIYVYIYIYINRRPNLILGPNLTRVPNLIPEPRVCPGPGGTRAVWEPGRVGLGPVGPERGGTRAGWDPRQWDSGQNPGQLAAQPQVVSGGFMRKLPYRQ